MPTKAQVQYHQRSVLSARHLKRMSEGRQESTPSEYRAMEGNEADRRAAVARSVLEDRRMMRELGL